MKVINDQGSDAASKCHRRDDVLRYRRTEANGQADVDSWDHFAIALLRAVCLWAPSSTSMAVGTLCTSMRISIIEYFDGLGSQLLLTVLYNSTALQP